LVSQREYAHVRPCNLPQIHETLHR
jgi:hypothetical protein